MTGLPFSTLKSVDEVTGLPIITILSLDEVKGLPIITILSVDEVTGQVLERQVLLYVIYLTLTPYNRKLLELVSTHLI